MYLQYIKFKRASQLFVHTHLSINILLTIHNNFEANFKLNYIFRTNLFDL